MLGSVDGGKNPAFETSEFPLSYGLVTLTILAVGFGLVQLGHRVGRGPHGPLRQFGGGSWTRTSSTPGRLWTCETARPEKT